jgi:hypothetical protein
MISEPNIANECFSCNITVWSGTVIVNPVPETEVYA